MQIQELLRQFETKKAEVDGLLSLGEGLTQEDVYKAQECNRELERLKGEIGRAQELEELRGAQKTHDLWLHQPASTVPHEGKAAVQTLGTAPAGSAYLESGRAGSALVTDDGEMLLGRKTMEVISSAAYRDAFRSYLRKGLAGITSAEYKALQEGADTSGGFVVPEDILTRIVMKEPTPTRVRGYVTQLNTGRDALVIPRVNYTTDDLYTTGIRSTWTGEVPASSTAHRVTEPVFGQLRIPINTNMMSMPLTNDIIEDSLFPLVSWASDRFSETIDLLYDNMILNGTGIGQPSGILMNPGATDQPAVVAIGNTGGGPTADGVVGLAWNLPEQYDTDARWVVNKTSVAQFIAKLKDSNGRYLWGDGFQDSGMSIGGLGNGVRRLSGYPVNLSGFMPNLGANNYVSVFGDFSGYYLVNRVGFSIQVLRELYAETNQVLLLGRIRFGGQVAEAWKLKIGQQA